MNVANHDPLANPSAANERRLFEREPFSLHGFDIVSPRGPEEVFIKLFHLQAAIQQGETIQVCMDFDHTLTDTLSESTWKASSTTLKGGLAEVSNIERAFYLHLQQRGVLTQSEESGWSCHELVRHVLNGTKDEDLAEASATIPLRAGARRLFQFFELNDQFMPIIVSGGIGNMISKILELHRIHVPANQILANRFLPRIQGQTAVFPDRSAIIGSGNKLENIVARFPSVADERCNTIALGDATTDAAMSFNGLAIRTCQAEGNDQTYLEHSAAARFDLVLRSSTLLSVGELLEQLVDILHRDENM